jgi:predicted phosphohydrolase
MRIQYCSDLHLEFKENSDYMINNPLSVKGDILILAGDIVPLHDENLANPFFNFISNNYKKVFWVPGNHEFYYRDINDFKSSLNIQLKHNIHILHNIEFLYDDINFVFSSLWSKISIENERSIEQSVADFDCIQKNNKKLRAGDFNKLHEESLSFIKQSLQDKKGKTVVVTHHLPSNLCNSRLHNDSPINEAFCVDLTDYVEKCDANFWLYGHSHFNQKPLYIGNTIMLTNQLGYVHNKEQGSFKNNTYFSL